MNVGYIVRRAARRHRDRIAIVGDGVQRTFAEVDERTDRLAYRLREIGLAVGDRVGVLMHNAPECIECDFGIAKAGLVRVPINARLQPAEIEYILNDSGARALITEGEFLAAINNVRGRVPTLETVVCREGASDGALGYEAWISGASRLEPLELPEESLAMLMYTSGTTGHPKGAMLTHRTWRAVVTNRLLDYDEVLPADVMLHVSPLSHASGSYVLCHFVAGATNAVLRKFTPDAILETIERWHVTTTMMVPTMINLLLAHPATRSANLSSLHTINYGAAPMPVEKLREGLEVFGRVFVQNYSLAEAPWSITVLPKSDHRVEGDERQLRRLGSCGRELFNVQVRIVDDKGCELPVGEPGEIIAHTDTQMRGYWQKPEATAETIRDGWVHTRDIGWCDEDGYIYIVDRKGEMIISGGFNIYPREVEEVLYMHPGVLEAAVIGTPDDMWGERVKAIVVAREGAAVTEDELLLLCEGNLARYKKPREFEFRTEHLPKSATGKILRRTLREEHWRGRARKV